MSDHSDIEKKIIKKIQYIFNLDETGEYDDLTSSAIKNFQNKNNIFPSGNLDLDTYYKLFDIEEPIEMTITSDLTELTTTVNDLNIKKYLLPKTEYYADIVKKKNIFIHHTAGWNNPYNVIDSWAKDTRGRVGTHYIIGGVNPVTEDTTYDGEILQCVPDENWIYHLGVSKYNSHLDKESIGIELCNFGYLILKDGNYITYAGQKVKPSQVCKLEKKFRGYEYWQSYSTKQIESLKKLILYLAKKYEINITYGLPLWLKNESDINAFEYKQEVINGNKYGLFTHTNVRKDKFDCFPDPKLIKMIGML